jgi:D-glycero-D-manno-heptose 1,7-bisphosphate phosphatase
MQPAVFLDRDGTIIEDVGYVSTPAQLRFIPGSIESIRMLNDAGYKVIVITNQSGVARGILSEDMLQTIDKIIRKQILSGGGHIDDIYYCPHHPEHGVYPYRQACECRKPHPGLIKKATAEHALDLSASFLVGDKSSDMETGKHAGIKTILVETGYGSKEKEVLKEHPDHFAKNLADAVKWILKEGK